MPTSKYKDIGVVREIWRYPVKSMAGEALLCSKVGWQGLAGDRQFSFLRLNNGSGLPFLSARELPSLILYSARFAEPENPDHSRVQVQTPDGNVLELNSPVLLAALEKASGCSLQVLTLWRRAYDSMPISMITVGSVASTSRALNFQLAPARFRPNLVVEAYDDRPYPEDAWVSEVLVFGDDHDPARVRLDRKDLRCSIVDLNPATGAPDCEVLKEVAKNRKNFLGAYASVVRPGRINVGDIVRIVLD